jgi:hypothetical protein
MLCVGQNHIFQVELWKTFAKKTKSTDSMRGILLHLSFSGLSSGKTNLHDPLGAQFSVVYFDRFTLFLTTTWFSFFILG